RKYVPMRPVEDVPMPIVAPQVSATSEAGRAAPHENVGQPPPPPPQPRYCKAPAERPHEALRRTIGEVEIARAAETLIANGAMRAIFVSPEGDIGAAASVLVAREIADAGLRAVLLDLTASGAASHPMLESLAFAGITN